MDISRFLSHLILNSVAAECTNFIGPVGYGYVQGKKKEPTQKKKRVTETRFIAFSSQPAV